jgi:hypothetical protein
MGDVEGNVRKVMENMLGKTVNIYVSGKIRCSLSFDDFVAWKEEGNFGDVYIVFSGKNTEDTFSFNRDEICNIIVDDNEVIFDIEEVGSIELWIDEVA